MLDITPHNLAKMNFPKGTNKWFRWKPLDSLGQFYCSKTSDPNCSTCELQTITRSELLNNIKVIKAKIEPDPIKEEEKDEQKRRKTTKEEKNHSSNMTIHAEKEGNSQQSKTPSTPTTVSNSTNTNPTSNQIGEKRKNPGPEQNHSPSKNQASRLTANPIPTDQKYPYLAIQIEMPWN